jgi:hypothetical protein
MQRSERLVREVYSVTLLQTPLSAGVADIVNAYAEDAGSDPAAGLLTSAAKSGASIFKMMDVSRRSSVDTLRRYVRDAELFRDHARAGQL